MVIRALIRVLLFPWTVLILLIRFLLRSWAEADNEAAQYRSESSSNSTSDALLAAYIFSIVAISLVLQEYLGDRHAFSKILRFIDDPFSPDLHPLLYSLVGWIRPEGSSLYGYLLNKGYHNLWLLSYWASWRVIGFLIIPGIAVMLHPRLRKSALGFTFKGMSRHIWIYCVLFIPVFIAVVIVSFSDEFSSYYPFYRNAHRSLFDFVVWETFYIAQFLSLEFFFRGFMLQPLRRTMGSSAIFAMMVPYVMIHIGKPMIECFAAVIAGIVLGTLAMRTKSIWAGFLIHVSVALSMDILAIWQVNW
ncbi:MAG: CPBP family intramembrane metalloprotease [Deltaproteobacteria bacterium]|nr:CPBP family intramembrane metalloprotease [Deltaproteobacteria bacterium]